MIQVGSGPMWEVLPTPSPAPTGSRVLNSWEASNRALSDSLVCSASQAWGRASCLPSWLLPRPSRLRPPGAGLQEPRWLLGKGAVSAELWGTSYAGLPRGQVRWFQCCSLMGTGSAWTSPLGGRCDLGGRGPRTQLGSSSIPRRGPRGAAGGGAANGKWAVPGASDPTSALSLTPALVRPQGPQADVSRAPDRPLPEGPPG